MALYLLVFFNPISIVSFSTSDIVIIVQLPLTLEEKSASNIATDFSALKMVTRVLLTYLMILNDGFRHMILLAPLRQTRSLF